MVTVRERLCLRVPSCLDIHTAWCGYGTRTYASQQGCNTRPTIPGESSSIVGLRSWRQREESRELREPACCCISTGLVALGRAPHRPWTLSSASPAPSTDPLNTCLLPASSMWRPRSVMLLESLSREVWMAARLLCVSSWVPFTSATLL
jgi:hypothetical protein